MTFAATSPRAKASHKQRPALRTIAAVCAIAWLWASPAQANINSDLTTFFDSIGGASNVTSPGAFQGQTQNVMSGGSLYVRLPQQTYNLANVQMPSIKAGCGGIDVFAGSFSYINKEQFVAMVRNIGNNALGYAFSLAIDAVDPLIGNVLKDMQKISQVANNSTINSCQTAQSLVNGLAGALDISRQSTCSGMAALLNISSDRSDGTSACADPAKNATVAQQVSANPELKKNAPINMVSGNLMGRVLERSFPWMGMEERNLLISMTGTYTYDNTDPDKPLSNIVPPTITSDEDILAGVQGTASAGQVSVMMHDCADPDLLRCPPPASKNITSLRALVQQRLTTYENAMQTGSTNWDPSTKAAMVGFVNISSVPVLQIMKMDFANKTQIRETYTDLIASQYAIYYLDTIVKQAVAAVSNYRTLGPDETTEVKTMRDALTHLHDVLSANMNKNSAKASAMANITLQLAKFDEVLRGNDASLATRIEASRSMGGGSFGAQ
jgi:conjugative transfer pilus assembly protein TraH